MCLLSERMKDIQSKMNSQDWPYHFSNYKSMGIFQFTQGQLTPQPLVRSTPDSNSVQTLWLSSIPERMKKIRSRMKAQEWPQDNVIVLRSSADKSEISGGNLQKFELIQVFMHVLVTCKNEEDSMKNEFARVATTFLSL